MIMCSKENSLKNLAHKSMHSSSQSPSWKLVAVIFMLVIPLSFPAMLVMMFPSTFLRDAAIFLTNLRGDEEASTGSRVALAESINEIKSIGRQFDTPALQVHSTSQMSPNNDATITDASEQCLDLGVDQDMNSLIAQARQIFVTMPAKAGGTSMKEFTDKCMKKEIQNNILNKQSLWKQFLIDSVDIPSIISSHMYIQSSFTKLINSVPRDALMIYIHREEVSRLISAIKYVARYRMCGVRFEYARNYELARYENDELLSIRRNDTHCILDEEEFVNKIAARDFEIGYSTHNLLNCQSYKAVHESAPHLVFLHYKQVDKLQRLLAKHHCPEMLDELPIRSNVAADDHYKILLHKRGSDESSTIELDEWLSTKGLNLEWTLGLSTGASCQVKTIHMEEELFGCPDETLRVSPESIQMW